MRGDAGRPKVRTCLWFASNAREAAEFYVSLLPQSRIESDLEVNGDTSARVVELTLAGVPYMLLQGGPQFTHTPAASIVVRTDDQAETDRLWAALTADGGAESMCGWLTDRFGVSWQITPDRLIAMINDTDSAAVGRAFAAMLTMRKIDIAALERAFAGTA